MLVKHCLDPNDPAELRQPVQLHSFLVYSNLSSSIDRPCRAQGFEGNCSINAAASLYCRIETWAQSEAGKGGSGASSLVGPAAGC